MSAAITKSWSTKSSVRRAVTKLLGATKVEGKHYEIVEKKDGTFTYRLLDQKAKPATKEKAIGEKLSARLATREIDTAKLDKELDQKEAKKSATKSSKLADKIEKAPSKVAPVEFTRKSTIEKPTKRVWVIADEMFAVDPETRRSTVIAECVREGIAFGTARTQYQHWFADRRAKEDEKAAKKAARKAGR